jgi:hypothetical protein
MTLARLFLCLFVLAPSFSMAQTNSASQASRCTTFAATPWVGGPTPRLNIEAFSDGPSCAKAVAVFVVRDASGAVLYSDSYQTRFVLPLSEARTRAHMQTALQRWMVGLSSANQNANLPNWLSGASAPVDREFGFTPAEGITRSDYLAVKSGSVPLLCYVQGMESIKCLVYRNGGMEDFGIQAFPG